MVLSCHGIRLYEIFYELVTGLGAALAAEAER
jgi:hypothetical protein